MRSFVLACATLLFAASAQAQPAQKGEVYGLGGMTFGTETSTVFGGGARFNVTPTIQVFGEAGRMQNVLPKSIQDAIDLYTSLYLYGSDVELDLRVPAVYGMGGVRFVVPTKGKVRPFVEGGVGIASLSYKLDAKVDGISLSDIEDELELESETELMFAFGGGVTADLNKNLGVDAGYRFVRISADDGVNTSSVYGGVHFKF